ncbi:SDR family oxidoreductase [uncultured Pseudokineococcus sp.]|uniref:SDR family NAD(P)-dependent oxidoreductase n=1 Tax=uncultured Pseudokineococcus sp. TaxID=1642928 RepID=UPI00260F8586|nr:SDR family oxidoreductase [uncultured Pseudokineococcus sp.]
MTDLQGARVLVTGASGGLGSLLAGGMAARGAVVAVSGRDEQRLRALEVEAVAHLPADLRQPGAPDALVGSAVEALGGLDVLVHAAGVVAFGPAAEVDDDLLDDLLLLHYLAPVRLLRAAVPHLRTSAAERGGAAAVMLSAVVAEQPVAGMAAYSAAKAALTAFDAAVAKELRRDRVRVLDVRPPHTETGLAGRPVAGEAPRMPEGLPPQDVVDRILRAVVDDERDLPSSAFRAG